MTRTFPIEFIRVALLQTLYEQHLENDYYFGGDNQINIFSFYEQLRTQDEVDRYVERYSDLAEQQNKSDLIGNGILVTTENPVITNLYSATIIPMNWMCSIRTKLSNRDQMIRTINNLIEELKGSKVDIAELETTDDNGRKCYIPFKVGTIGHNTNHFGRPVIKKGDYLGFYETSTPETDNFPFEVACDLQNDDYVYMDNETELRTYKVSTDNTSKDKVFNNNNSIFEAEREGESGIMLKWTTKRAYANPVAGVTRAVIKLSVGGTLLTWDLSLNTTIQTNGLGQLYRTFAISASGHDTTEIDLSTAEVTITGKFIDYSYTRVYDDGTNPEIVFCPENDSFKKYKLSMSFESIRCDEPRVLNHDEYCEISFGGSATLVNEKVKLGNDLIKVGVRRNKLISSETQDYNKIWQYAYQYLEPMEMPSGSSANTVISQLTSNKFKQNTHTDGLSLNLQYTFILDESIDILKEWFEYARYGNYGTTSTTICPNIIYDVREIWSAWGKVRVYDALGKIVENIDIEDTESDTLTLGLTFQLQGENN